MAEISVVGPEAGEPTLSGPASVRIIEDGSTTSGRLGMAEIVVAPHARDLAAADGQPPSPPQIAEVMARYATEPAG